VALVCPSKSTRVNSDAGRGDKHGLVAVVPPHDVGRLASGPFDLDHLTTAGRIPYVQAWHCDAVTD
jgi:hypothetical protein